MKRPMQAGGAVAAVIMLCAGVAGAGENCTLIDNGSFDQGLEGWSVEKIETVRGDGTAEVKTLVYEPIGWFAGMDDAAFGAVVTAVATGKQAAGFGETLIDVRLSRTLEVEGPELEILINGGGDITWWGLPTIGWDIELEIEDPDGATHIVPVTQDTVDTTPSHCDVGLFLAGFYNHPFNPEYTNVDLFDVAGVQVGDTITLTVHYRVDLIAPGPCDQATYYPQFLVDHVSFCGATDPADLDGDGSVDVADLLELLAAWGSCNACPADLDADGAIGVNDLLMLLAAWTA